MTAWYDISTSFGLRSSVCADCHLKSAVWRTAVSKLHSRSGIGCRRALHITSQTLLSLCPFSSKMPRLASTPSVYNREGCSFGRTPDRSRSHLQVQSDQLWQGCQRRNKKSILETFFWNFNDPFFLKRSARGERGVLLALSDVCGVDGDRLLLLSVHARLGVETCLATSLRGSLLSEMAFCPALRFYF